MGRLTLNMLLSFAQFEREVTGERIRDKIAASKRKGMWMGGPVPLGYEVEDRKLVVNETEAEIVRHIMRALPRAGLGAGACGRTQSRRLPHQGAEPRPAGRTEAAASSGAARSITCSSNRIYRGQDHSQGRALPLASTSRSSPRSCGTPSQARLAGNAPGHSRRLQAQQPSLLIGLVFDGEGRAMTPSHATKPAQALPLLRHAARPARRHPAWRVSAHDLEQLVCGKLVEKLTERRFTVSVIGEVGAEELQKAIADADLAAATLRSSKAHHRAELLSQLVTRIDLHEDRMHVTLDVEGLQQLFGLSSRPDIETPAIAIEAVRIRRGHQLRLIVPGPDSGRPKPGRRNEKLVALVAEARLARELVLANPAKSIACIAKADGRCRTRLTRLVALSCLAPHIVTAIVEGKQPEHLTANRLASIELPLSWTEQRVALSFS